MDENGYAPIAGDGPYNIVMRKKRTFNLHFLRTHARSTCLLYKRLFKLSYVRSCYSYFAFCYCKMSHFEYSARQNNELFIRSIKTFRIFNTLPVTLSTRLYDHFVTKVQLFSYNFSLRVIMLKTRLKKRSYFFYRATQ